MVNSPPLGPPAGRPPMSRGQIIGARIAGVIGLLLILATGSVIAIAPGAAGSVGIDGTYVWRSGSRLFIDNISDLRATNCTLTGSTTTRQISVGKRSNSVFVNFQTNGTYVARFEPGPIKVTCDYGAGLTTGPLLWLFPLGATPLPFVLGIILIVCWHVKRGGRRTQLFFGPRTRPGLPD
jgi:ABC-type Na+ efflux pump permease subunit